MSEIDKLTETILKSPKYQFMSEAVIRRIGEVELAKGRKFKEAVKATRNKLHQTSSAYLSSNMRYKRWLSELDAAEDLRATCRNIMHNHASTAERLPILETFYEQIFAGLPRVETVVDVACGLNALALPWMPEDLHYTGYDIHADMMDFITSALPYLGAGGVAGVRDIIGDPPQEPYDVALVLKTIPCLEQADKDAGLALLDSLNAKYLVVSFPTASIGGRDKGMRLHYEAHFRNLIAQREWAVQQLDFAAELAFIVQKTSA